MTRRGMARLVGRQTQLADLDHVRRVAADGESRIVLISGEAGVGKTRCLTEIAERAKEFGTVILLGGCPPLTAGEVPYAPLAQALRAFYRTADGDTADWLRTHCPTLCRLVPGVGSGAAAATPSRSGRGRVFVELTAFLERLSATAPVMLSIEDIHWSDRSTRDVLTLILRATQGLGLLLVLTLRTGPPDEAVTGWLAELDRVVGLDRCELPPLDQADSATLIEDVLGAIPTEALVTDLYDRTGGNPFFIEELLTAYQAGSQSVPVSVQEAVLAQMMVLPEPARAMVAVAAVIGGAATTIDHDLLTAVGLVDVVAAVRSAVAGRLLEPAGPAAYAFRHAVTRDVVAASLLPVERQRWHERIARALEAAAPDFVGLARIAHHWQEARDAPRALAAAVRAGEAAFAASAFPTAVRLYEQALALWPDVAAEIAGIDEVELWLRTAEAITRASHGQRAVQLTTDALARIDPATDPHRAARARLLHNKAHWAMTGDETRARRESEEILALIPEPVQVRLDTLVDYAILLRIGDWLEQSRQVSVEALALSRRLGDRQAEGHSHVNMAVCGGFMGDPQQALAELHDYIERGIAATDADVAMEARIGLANMYILCGRLNEAADTLILVERSAIRNGFEDAFTRAAAGWAVLTMVDVGRWAEAEARVRAPLPDTPLMRAIALSARIALSTGRGETTAARTDADELAVLAAQGDANQLATMTTHVIAELDLWTGRPQSARSVVAAGLRRFHADSDIVDMGRLCWLALRAEADLREAGHPADPGLIAECTHWYETAQTMDFGFDRVMATLAEAEHARIEGRPAAPLWEQAAAGCTRMGARYLALYPRWRAAQAYLAVGDRSSAVGHLREAYRTADDLGAEPIRQVVNTLARRMRLRMDPRTDGAPIPYGLTARELDVLRQLAHGITNREIARLLFISERTVDIHVSRILAKVGATRRTEAALMAVRLGLVTG